MKPIFTVKDRAVDVFGTPFVQQSVQQAIRGFKDEANSDPDKSAIAKHPDDYDLYQIGEYDELDGTITPGAPKLIARAKDLIQPGA